MKCLWMAILAIVVGNMSLVECNGDERAKIQPTRVTLIRPGSIISDRAPEGWTYLLFKNTSRISAGDVEATSTTVKQIASMFSSAMVARVEQLPSQDGSPQAAYTLTDVGYGLFTKVGNTDMVISTKTYKQLGADIGILGPLALSQAEARLEKLTLTARTPSMAIVDSPTIVNVRGEHRDAYVRHAVLIGRTTGNVVTLIWFIEPPSNGASSRLLSDIDYLPHGSFVPVSLHVDKNLFSFGLITEKSLALNQMMFGKTQVKMPPAAEHLARLYRFTPDQITVLENELRAALK